MARKTQDEINRQIAALKKMRDRLPEYTAFGDNNWEKIDAQLDILEGRHDKNFFWQDENAEEYEDGDNDAYWDAEKAEDWLNGSDDEDLADEEDYD
jgi:hypothetical protein